MYKHIFLSINLLKSVDLFTSLPANIETKVIVFTVSLFIDLITQKSILFLPLALSTAITGITAKWITPRLHQFNFHQIIRR